MIKCSFGLPLFILIGSIIISCSSNSPAEYLNIIPDGSEFEYIPLSETLPDSEFADSSTIRFVTPTIWTDSRDLELPKQAFSLESIDSVVWVADPVSGELKSFSLEGVFLKHIAQRGKGPGDVEYPAIIKKGPCTDNAAIECVWIIDTGSRALIEYDLNGVEKQRIINRTVPHAFFNVQFEVMKDGRFILPIVGDSGFTAGIINRKGQLEDKIIRRVVPLGYQPSAYNNLKFSYQSENDLLAYAYYGLPQVYIRTLSGGPVKMYDLYPGVSLHEFNRELTPYKVNDGNNGISGIINNIELFDDYMLFTIKTTLFVLNLNTDRIDQIIHLKNPNGEKLKFHQFVLTGENIFLLDRFRLIYYRFPVSEITGGLQPVAQINE